jgi:1-pyrroline-5-carboxylate dehydrogenase
MEMPIVRDELFEEQLTALRAAGPVQVPHFVSGGWIAGNATIERQDPCHPGRVVSMCGEASDSVVDRAVAEARRAASTWGVTPVAKRASVLHQLLHLLTDRRRVEIAALIALETGKNRTECIGEVDELAVLIDRYTAAGADATVWEEPLQQVNPCETSRSVLRPFGVFGVISPFNYPMVLGAGPAVAALVAGNTVVWKPSHVGPRSAHAFAELIAESGLDSGVFQMVLGGDSPGRRVVQLVDGVAFTGSVEAGLAIRAAASLGPFPRPVIAELGGKNPVVVTDTADLELAATAIVSAAFGMSGQRCSAASRVIVTSAAHDRLVELMLDATSKLVVADPIRPACSLGPVVDEQAVTRLERFLATARRDGVVATGGRSSLGGLFIDPVIVTDLPHGHPLTREELFLPFLTVTRAATFEEALTEANATKYGLTAGIYSGDAVELTQFALRMESGCINVNKPGGGTTGWWPGNQTFGGWKASGLSGKQAFGDWYVQQFAREQCVTLASGLEFPAY